MIQVATESGCLIYVHEVPENISAVVKSSYQWSGACVGRLGQGKGTLVEIAKADGVESSTSSQVALHAGYPIGYRRSIVKSEYLEATSIFGSEAGKPKRVTTTQISDSFTYGDRTVGVGNLGLKIGELALTNDQIVLPSEGIQNVSSTGNIGFKGESYVQAMMPCKFFKDKVPEFAGCNYGSPEGELAVPVLFHIKNTSGQRETQRFFCPNPKSFDAVCAEKFYTQTSSVRKEVIDFIASNIPSVQAILQRINTEGKK